MEVVGLVCVVDVWSYVLNSNRLPDELGPKAPFASLTFSLSLAIAKKKKRLGKAFTSFYSSTTSIQLNDIINTFSESMFSSSATAFSFSCPRSYESLDNCDVDESGNPYT